MQKRKKKNDCDGCFGDPSYSFDFLDMVGQYSIGAEYIQNSKRRPSDGFDGYRIAHVSDLHNAELGEENEALLTILHDAEPDVIAITGDLIESRNTDIEIALQFAAKAVKIAPCYYVTGNHEARIFRIQRL